MPTSQQVEQVVAALTDPLVIKPLSEEACGLVAQGFLEMGWSKPQGHFEAYYQQQLAGTRLVLVAYVQNEFAGYLSVLWQSQYPSFAAQGIPEINDLNVLPRFRQKGVASRLLDVAERECLKQAPAVGLGVGLYADYGAAQRLYVRRGYRPDGCGVTYHNRLVRPGASVCVDDELILWFIKQGPPAAC